MLNLDILNAQQRQAVIASLCPILVSAGAGSGKTRVLAYRIAYLIERGLVPPHQILALTFTNKAAREMQDRVQQLLNTEISNIKYQISNKSQNPNAKNQNGDQVQLYNFTTLQLPTMGTFHSIGARILREHGQYLGLPRGFTIFDDDDSGRLIKRIAKELEVPEKLSASWLSSLISSAKNALISPEAWQPAVPQFLVQAARKVFELYEKELRKAGGVDFDDLIVLPVRLWRDNISVREYYQQKFNYILIDEYQDTNGAQYQWLKLLVTDGNVFAVGDDAQSIYGFRGSDFSNWQNFQKDFAGCQVIHLEQNYRSTQNILDAAGKVLASNDGHTLKQLWTESKGGEVVRVKELLGEGEEAVFVAKTIARWAASVPSPRGRGEGEGSAGGEYYEDEGARESQKQSNIAGGLLDKYLAKARTGRHNFLEVNGLSKNINPELLKNIAILYRTHGQSRALEEVLISSGIPYRIIGGVRFYQRKEIKDVLAMLRLLVNPRDFISLERVVSALPLGIGEKSLPHLADALSGSAVAWSPPLEGEGQGGVVDGYNADNRIWDLAVKSLSNSPLKTAQRNGALQLFADMSILSNIHENNSVVSVLREILTKMQLSNIIRDGTEQGEARWENVQELISVAATRASDLPWQEGAAKLLEEAALLAAQDEVTNQNAVQLMTIHAAKGLEFDSVLVMGWEDGVLPHARSLWKPEELAEEVRLAYVAMTRARKNLFLTYARSRALGASFGAKSPSRFLRHLPEEGVSWERLRGYNITLPSSSMKDDLVYEAVEE